MDFSTRQTRGSGFIRYAEYQGAADAVAALHQNYTFPGGLAGWVVGAAGWVGGWLPGWLAACLPTFLPARLPVWLGGWMGGLAGRPGRLHAARFCAGAARVRPCRAASGLAPSPLTAPLP